jgi:hypothetical protein
VHLAHSEAHLTLERLRLRLAYLLYDVLRFLVPERYLRASNVTMDSNLVWEAGAKGQFQVDVPRVLGPWCPVSVSRWLGTTHLSGLVAFNIASWRGDRKVQILTLPSLVRRLTLGFCRSTRGTFIKASVSEPTRYA